jgi:hypothetical protein
MGLYGFIAHTAENGVKDLYLEVPITNGSGAVGTPVRQKGFGLVGTTTTPIVRNSAGNYTLNLDQRWQGLVEFDVNFADGTMAATDGYTVQKFTRSLNSAQPTIVFQLVQASGAAADPFAGSGAGSMLIHLALKDSTV